MTYVSSDILRQEFAHAMSNMYRSEVPLYGELLDLVAEANNLVLKTQPEVVKQLAKTDNLNRLTQERHGAIRLGKASELHTMRRLFSIMGMFPVSYYDLSIAGIPVHSTAFRPIKKEALSINPFRVFTSLLRTDLIGDIKLRKKAESTLESRNIFSNELMELIESAEQYGGVSITQKDKLIQHAVDVFRWHDEALIDIELYQQLNQNHRLIADVVSFKGPHINHLTPATLNIDYVQSTMPAKNITPKAIVEGPPKRRCPLLLRQTSFKAIEEPVTFHSKDGQSVEGNHTARFGEIEQRGIALTPKGQTLYNHLLNNTRKQIIPKADGSNAQEYNNVWQKNFSTFPDTYAELRKKELAYFSYSINNDIADKELGKHKTLQELIDLDFVHYDPIIYEDFLPVSAAGIFQSNLGNADNAAFTQKSNKDEFENALGRTTIDSFELYRAQQRQSINTCLDFFYDDD